MTGRWRCWGRRWRGGDEKSQRARLIRTTRTALGLSQTEFAGRFRVPDGTLRDWEQARVSPSEA